MGRTANRGQHGTEEEEAAKLPPMAEVKQERSTPAAGHLEVKITSPVMGCSRTWPRFCYLEAYLGGDQVALQELPMKRKTRQPEEKEWKVHLMIPVGMDWPHQSLDLAVKRFDYNPERGNLQPFRGGPHTSRCDAVTGRARVKLMDVLILGDEDEEEEEEEEKEEAENRKPKRRRKEFRTMMERTLLFNETVELEDLMVSEPKSAPRLVHRGTVDVRMGMHV